MPYRSFLWILADTQSHLYAGIAGLASALALARVGHRVTVLEKGDGKSNVSGFSKTYAVCSP